jgi:peptide deformylase
MVYADDPHLRDKSKKVKVFGPALEGLVKDLLDTLEDEHGLGLAAPQIGVHERVIVIDMPEDEEDPQSGQTYVLVNPEIVRREGEQEGEEGCLSIPGWYGLVTRAYAVTVKAQTPKGKPLRLKGQGLLARALQHEIDHLDGVLYIDRIDDPAKLRKATPKEETAPEEGEYVLAATR